MGNTFTQSVVDVVRCLRSAAVRFLVPALLCVGGSVFPLALPPAAAQTTSKLCLPVTSTASGVAVQSCFDVSTTNPLPVTVAPGITSIVSAIAEATHVLKASPGNLYSVYATNLTATAGFLVVTNTTSAPVDGAIAPLDWCILPANGSCSVSYGPGPPDTYGVGITATLTSAVTPLTKTTGVITGVIHAQVQ